MPSGQRCLWPYSESRLLNRPPAHPPRDLNPRNVLISMQADAVPLACVAKIADFGLSHQLPEGKTFIANVNHGMLGCIVHGFSGFP